jgi:hypothetical protein
MQGAHALASWGLRPCRRDQEANLLRIVLGGARSHPQLDTAVEAWIAATYASFAGWLEERANIDLQGGEALAVVGLGALFASPAVRLFIGRDTMTVDDDRCRRLGQMRQSQIPN